jgi:hypothetical protein
MLIESLLRLSGQSQARIIRCGDVREGAQGRFGKCRRGKGGERSRD